MRLFDESNETLKQKIRLAAAVWSHGRVLLMMQKAWSLEEEGCHEQIGPHEDRQVCSTLEA